VHIEYKCTKGVSKILEKEKVAYIGNKEIHQKISAYI
jgi:hypothetical protein